MHMYARYQFVNTCELHNHMIVSNRIARPTDRTTDRPTQTHTHSLHKVTVHELIMIVCECFSWRCVSSMMCVCLRTWTQTTALGVLPYIPKKRRMKKKKMSKSKSSNKNQYSHLVDVLSLTWVVAQRTFSALKFLHSALGKIRYVYFDCTEKCLRIVSTRILCENQTEI